MRRDPGDNAGGLGHPSNLDRAGIGLSDETTGVRATAPSKSGVVPTTELEATRPTEITERTTITEPGSYVLGGDLSASSGEACIEVRSDDVLFDGRGYTIVGAGDETTGVHVPSPAGTSFSNVVVRNVVIEGARTGVSMVGVRTGAVGGVRVRLSRDGEGSGVAFEDVSDVVVSRVEVVGGAFESGLHVVDSREVALLESCVSEADVGIALVGTTASKVVGNEFEGNWVGISASDSDDNLLAANGGTAAVPYELTETKRTQLIGNRSDASKLEGVRVDSSDENRFIGNVVVDGVGGFTVRASRGNRFEGNRASGHLLDGFGFSGAVDTELSGNTATENGGFGYSIRDSASTEGGDNRAERNGRGPVSITNPGNAVTVDGVVFTGE